MITDPWPTQLRIDMDARLLEIAFDDGTAFKLPAELLRVESPSAEVQGHGPGQKVIVAGKRMVTATNAEPVGNYAVRLIFSDGHASGLFTWRYLRELGERQDELWRDYLAALEEKGLSRDPR